MNMRYYHLLLSAAIIPVSWGISSAEMASKYGLGISDFDEIIRSESASDFGTSAESDELWLDATARQWDFNGLGVLSDLGPSNVFYPYVLCYSDPELSGFRRTVALSDMLANAGAQVDVDVFLGGTIVNVKEARTCIWTSSLTWPYLQMIETAPPEMAQYLEVQPHMFSMKIVEGTSERVEEQMTERFNGATTEEFLGLAVTMCPVYSEIIKLGMATYEGLVDDYLQFLTEDRGYGVYNSSFYVFASDAYPSVTQGIQMWSDVIKNVVGRTDPSTGANYCLDVVIGEELTIRRDYDDVIAVHIEEHDGTLSEEELKDCLWYIMAGLALHPYACQIEDKGYPVAFPGPAPSAPGTTTNGNPTGTDYATNGEPDATMPSHACERLSSVSIALFITLASWMALCVISAA